MNPTVNKSLSVPFEGRDEELMNIENGNQQPIALNLPRSSLFSVAPPDNYLGRPLCTTPKLPSNTNVQFNEQMKAAIRIFKDKSKSEQLRSSSQRLVEKFMVERGTCSYLNPTIMNDFRLRLFNIDSEELDDELSTEKSLNANMHDEISCAVDAVIYKDKFSGTFAPSMRERIKNWFPEVKLIGQESTEGYALRTSFTPDTNLFVMKAPRNPKIDELAHEALVGFYAMNKLRHILPNYMYVYGYTNCSPPVVQDKDVLAWCSSSTPGVSYLITENIRDSVPINEFVTNPSVSWTDLLIVFYQILNALNLAHKLYGYTHYDLHYGNILVRKYSKKIAIPFLGQPQQVIGYLSSQYIPYIIDYGFSRITVGGVGFGKIGLESSGIDGDYSFPMYDIYKIIGFMGQSMYLQPVGNRSSFYSDKLLLLEKLFSFFGGGKLVDRVQARLSSDKDFYIVGSNYRSITYEDYIKWLRSSSSGIADPVLLDLLSLVSNGVYPAPINTYLDTCTFYDMITSQAGPESSLEYCEALFAINEDSILAPNIKQEAISWLNSNFDSERHFIAALPGIINEINQIKQTIDSRLVDGTNIIPDIRTISIPVLTQQTNIDAYKVNILNLIVLKDFVSRMFSFYKSSTCSLVNQEKYLPNKFNLDRLNDIVNQWSKNINEQREILKRNLIFSKSQNWQNFTSDPNALNFWQTEHENLILAV